MALTDTVELNKEFWLKLRDKMFPEEFDGRGFGYIWIECVSKKLDELAVSNNIMVYREHIEGPIWPNAGHTWISYKDPDTGLEMISDGIAGYLDEKFPTGFYGVLDEIQGKLHEVYSNGELKVEERPFGFMSWFFE